MKITIGTFIIEIEERTIALIGYFALFITLICKGF